MDYLQTVKEMRQWLKDEVTGRGFTQVVLGVSGGFDSALSAYIASHEDCLGEDGVFGVLMPCESSRDSIDDGLDLCNKLKLNYYCINTLYDAFQTIVNVLDDVSLDAVRSDKDTRFINLTSPLSKGNIKARLRMIMLYAFANSMKAMVLNTSNFSEIMSGNGTKFGDAAGDIALFHEFTKTEMYEMAKAISFDKYFPSIFNKVPTADLEPNQTDEKTMGVTYEKLDNFIQGKTNLVDWETQKNILKLISRSSHKREKMPCFRNFNKEDSTSVA